ncbi:Tripeptidyl-peptidase sed1 [Lachnellula suecica]|uniref:tripeptidyl-peptidase II n=1 Tax=Lachnellula suecica TaxID=602035 RepID=A0A8T9CNZ9_9HELO|nr:Tripeptidyl-peptidase sed1 [Lachnellula suecica]
MHYLSFVTLALALGTSLATPTPRNGLVQHEKREFHTLVKKRRADSSQLLPVRIALAQTQLDAGPERLLDISDPHSPNFGKHMTAKEIGDLFRPSSESIGAVRDWLHDAGINTERHTVSAGKGWLKFHASVEELESLLSTQYHVFEHLSTKETHIGCDDYHLPVGIAPHIDFITPSVSTILLGDKAKKQKRNNGFKSDAFQPHTEPAPFTGKLGDLELPCHVAVTPACLRKLYGIPRGSTSVAGNQIGIFEEGDFYNQADLDLTFEALARYVPAGSHPTLKGIDGGTAPLPPYDGTESLLDISIILPLIHPQQAFLFQTDDLKEVYVTEYLNENGGFGNTFLDALDASYCTFEGGDDPIDPQYPDTGPSNESWIPAGTWDNPEMCGAYKPTNVLSISYGVGENAYSRFYLNRQCLEFLKLGLQGTTVVYASGDSGVSDRYRCIASNNTEQYDEGAFSPSFPASCPWVTTVGATQYNDDDKTEVAVGRPENGYSSGGGFSNYWSAPSYQESTLATYFTNTPPSYGITKYGTPYYNGSGRGYPDVSAIGRAILIYNRGEPELVDGTSASAPIFASIINLINERRLAAGKPTVGFVNPTLYKNPQAFTDITSGSNPGCGTNGFDAVKGWDPVTGLGTPIFDKLLKVFMALPDELHAAKLLQDTGFTVLGGNV